MDAVALDRTALEMATEGLPGLETLVTLPSGLHGRDFRPSDPMEAAAASRGLSGLLETVEDDADGLEAPRPFGQALANRPVTAIDAGVVNLGHTADGIVGAVRAAAVTHYPDGRVVLRTYRPGIFVINSTNRLDLFHGMGAALGREDHYVKVDGGRPVKEKVNLAAHDHRLFSRVNNFVERLVQRQLCKELHDGIILVDGALTLRTYDTPQAFLHNLHAVCQDNELTLVAVAKSTGLTIRGVDIRLLIDSAGGLPLRRKLTRALRLDPGHDDAHRALGQLYVARFAPGGATYRVDSDPGPGYTSDQAVDELYHSCLFRSGYPEPLIEAHAFSYITPPAVAQLQSFAIVTNDLIVHPEPNLGPVFAPFGGRYK